MQKLGRAWTPLFLGATRKSSSGGVYVPIATYQKNSTAVVTNLSEPKTSQTKPPPVTMATNNTRRLSGVSSASSSGSNDSEYDSDRRRKLLKRF